VLLESIQKHGISSKSVPAKRWWRTATASRTRLGLQATRARRYKTSLFFLGHSVQSFSLLYLVNPNGAVLLPDGEIAITMDNGLKVWVSPKAEPIIDRFLYIYGAYEANLMCGCWSVSCARVTCSSTLAQILAICRRARPSSPALWGWYSQLNRCRLHLTYSSVTFNLTASLTRCRLNVALGCSDDRLELPIPPTIGRGGAGLLPLLGAVRGEMVAVTTLDSLSSSHRIDRCRMVKVDVEGFESKVIAGGRDFFSRRAADIICMEYSVTGGDGLWEPIVAVNQLLAYGYLLYRSTVWKGSRAKSRLVPIESLESLPEHDNVYFLSPKSLPTISITSRSDSTSMSRSNTRRRRSLRS